MKNFVMMFILFFSPFLQAQFELQTPVFTEGNVPQSVELPTCDLYDDSALELDRGAKSELVKKGYTLKDTPAASLSLANADEEITRLHIRKVSFGSRSINGRKSVSTTYAVVANLTVLEMEMFRLEVSDRNAKKIPRKMVSLLPSCVGAN